MHDFVTNDWFILITGLSGIVGLLIAMIARNEVKKIKKYIDNSKEVNQKNTFGKNEANINGWYKSE